jgi:hypothetical protein
MTTNHDDEQLDALLGQWADQSAAPDGLDDLHTRIVSELLESPSDETRLNGHATQLSGSPAGQAELGYPHRRGWRPDRWAVGFAVGSAMMLLVSVGVFWFALQDHGSVSESDLPPDYAWLRDEQIQNKEVLLAEMENMFDSQLAWLAETGDRVEFGLDRSAAGDVEQLPSDATRLAVRVVVERRPQGSADWQLAWALDVVSRSEEVVRVAPRNADGNELRLWTYQLPDGLIAIDSELQMAGRDQFHGTTSGIHQDRQPVQILTGRDKGTEYRVFQTVAVLDGKVS